MHTTEWVLIDTETTGFVSPVYTVELAAQRMCGWEPVGEPFRKLLNQNQDIPPEASRVHGYTREILERDGEPPAEVYRAFASYVGGLPLVSYNLEYDLSTVLLPEWERLNIPAIGVLGFCALRLAQRLLDPVPAGNCKLQTLRQYYNMPERGAHTALGDVMTVADLLHNVLRPIAEQRGINTWSKILRYAGDEWYPSRIAFGKFKGQNVFDARRNSELRKWLEWLAKSSHTRNAAMGRWYLAAIDDASLADQPVVSVGDPSEAPSQVTKRAPVVASIVLYVHPDLESLRSLVAASRSRLADLEAVYTTEKAKVSALQARLFRRLRPQFERRDRIRLIVKYRQAFLDALFREGEDAAKAAEVEYKRSDANTRQEYAEEEKAMSGRHELSQEDEGELKSLWKRLVKLFHPDRYQHDPVLLESYSKLTAAINHAKDNGDLATLRSIADNPAAFVLRQGWAAIEFGDSDEVEMLRKLLSGLELEIIHVIEATTELHESPDYELCQLTERNPALFDEVVNQQIATITTEIAELDARADQLKSEIAELTGSAECTIG